MKFFHISDLHIGKRLNEIPLIDDQQYIFGRILGLVDSEKPDAVLICGDVYDKPVPPAEAVRVFDDFLTALSDRSVAAIVISGNHDSPERIAFGARLLSRARGNRPSERRLLKAQRAAVPPERDQHDEHPRRRNLNRRA